MKKKTLLSWSSGKDSAWTLHCLRTNQDTPITGLFTVINKKYDRASMHATRITLLEKQAEAARLPLTIIELPDQCSNHECDAIMARHIRQFESEGVKNIAFGDLFLEDIRCYRETQLAQTTIKPVFPLWNIPTWQLAEQMLAGGMEAYISSVDLSKLPAEMAGKKWDRELIHQIPSECDPCGENGEMHSIVVGGPMFAQPIPVRIGKTIERSGFAFADIIPL